MRSARFTFAAWALLLCACGQTRMVDTMGRVREHMLDGNYPAALATLQKAKETEAFKEQDRVMFWMEEGLLIWGREIVVGRNGSFENA